MRVPILLAIWATVLAIFAPRRFRQFEERVTKAPAASNNNSVEMVSRGFWTAIVVVLAADIFGGLLGLGLSRVAGPPTRGHIAALQIVGVSILLLATIYLRGSAIETWDRNTLIERVDRWIYIGGYFLGTAFIVISIIWSWCR